MKGDEGGRATEGVGRGGNDEMLIKTGAVEEGKDGEGMGDVEVIQR